MYINNPLTNQTRIKMKKSITLLLSILILVFVYGQDKPSTVMFERNYLTPKPDKIKILNQNLATHNKKYHGDGDHYAFVYLVITGRRSGDYLWLMGPGTFANLDTRPAEGGHDDDWADNVMPYVQDISQNEYWVRDEKHYYTPKGYSGDKVRVRYYRIKPGTNEKFRELMGKILKVNKEKYYNSTFNLFWNTFPTNRGRNVATVSGFPNWAVFDEDNNFGTDYESVHGDGSWQTWNNEFWEVNEWTDNEVLQLVPKLGGSAEN